MSVAFAIDLTDAEMAVWQRRVDDQIRAFRDSSGVSRLSFRAFGFFVAFAVKFPVVPVHSWLPDAMAAATPPALCGTPARLRPISTPARVPISVRSLISPRWPMRKAVPASRPSPPAIETPIVSRAWVITETPVTPSSVMPTRWNISDCPSCTRSPSRRV